MKQDKKSPKENQSDYTNEIWAKKVSAWREDALQAWRSVHWDWYKYENFYRGNHYTYYEKQSGKVVNMTQGVTVNLTMPVIRGVANNVMKLRPKWSFYPTEISSQSYDQALKLSKLMDKYFDILDMKQIMWDVVETGLLLSSCPVFVGFDPSKNNGNGDVVVNVINPYYFLPDPTATSLDDCRYIIRIVKRSLAEVLSDPHYDQKVAATLKPELKLGATPIYEKVIKDTTKIKTVDTEVDERMGYVFVTECYIKELVDLDKMDSNPDYESEMDEDIEEEYKGKDISVNSANPDVSETVKAPEKKDYDEADNDSDEELSVNPLTKKAIRIRLICSVGDAVLYNEITDLEDYPFEMYHSDKNPFSMYGEGWMKNLIPLNQVINKHETQKLEYIDRMIRGMWIMKKGSKVWLGNTDGVKTLYYDAQFGDKPEQMQLQSYPSTIDSSTQAFRSYIEDIGNFHDVSSGKTPTGVKAARAIEALKDSDSNNTIRLKDNLEMFLTRLTKKILWNIAKYQVVERTMVLDQAKDVKVEGGTETIPNALRFISAESELSEGLNLSINDTTHADVDDILRIASDNELRVTIESDLAYTEQGRRETLLELYQLQAIDLETLLSGYKFGNVKEIIENLEHQKQEMMAQKIQEQAALSQAQMGLTPDVTMGGTPPTEQPAETPPAQPSLEQLLGRGMVAQNLVNAIGQQNIPAPVQA